MNDNDLLRYSRHILLNELGIEGQQKISLARVLVVGAGGLGSPAAMYLAASGVGTIVLADSDTVDLTNLQRQIIHTTENIGRPKTDSGKQTLLRLNPEILIKTVPSFLDAIALDELIPSVDLILDCSDNFATRQRVNRACVKYSKPLVSGAAIRFDGQITVFDPRRSDSPCYACLFPEDAEIEEVRCATLGVFAPLTGMVGAIQAAEALKLIAGFGEQLVGRLLLIDALTMTWRNIAFKRDPDCPVCGIA